MPRIHNSVRELIIEAIEQGKDKTWVALAYNVCTQTIDKFIKLNREGKLFDIIKKGGFDSKVDMNKLKQYIDNNPTKYYWEIGEEFGVCESQACNLVLKLGYTVKKQNHLP
jgi:Transposase